MRAGSRFAKLSASHQEGDLHAQIASHRGCDGRSAVALAAAPAAAQTLEKIKQRGVLVVGSKADYKPFGFRDPSGAIVGFEPDIAKLVADKLGVKLEIEPVVSSNRMQFLQQGKIDLMIATMNDKPDRRQVVGIIEPLYYASGVNVLANKKAGAEDLGAAQGPEGLRHPGRLVQQAGRREIRRRHRRVQGPDRGRGRAAAGQLRRLGL